MTEWVALSSLDSKVVASPRGSKLLGLSGLMNMLFLVFDSMLSFSCIRKKEHPSA